MTDDPAPQRLSVVWSAIARAQVRSVDRETALQILHCLDRYLRERNGDVAKLKSPLIGFRLRCGDYRVLFVFTTQHSIEVRNVFHRREAYR